MQDLNCSWGMGASLAMKVRTPGRAKVQRSMMNGGMGAMMAWMMGLGLLGWVLVIALLATILVVLVRILARDGSKQHGDGPNDRGTGEAH